MDTTSMFGFMDIIVIFGGLYVLYSYYLLMVKGDMRPGLIIPKDMDPKKCSDPAGFKKAIGTPTLLFGIFTLLTGCVGAYQDYIGALPGPIYWILFGLFFVVVIAYGYINKKATDKYFRGK